MSKFTYNGNGRSLRVAGVLFEKDIETELNAEQLKAFKADGFSKAFLDDGSIVESKAAEKAGDKKNAKD